MDALGRLDVLEIEESCAERIVGKVGKRLRSAEQAQIANCESALPLPQISGQVSGQVSGQASRQSPKPPDGKRLYVSMDAARGAYHILTAVGTT